MTSTYVARSRTVAARMVGDQLMIMCGRNSTLFALNATAALIWDAADGVTPLEEIVERQICAQFDVEPAAALQDARQLVDDLAGHGILSVSDVPVPNVAAGTPLPAPE